MFLKAFLFSEEHRSGSLRLQIFKEQDHEDGAVKSGIGSGQIEQDLVQKYGMKFYKVKISILFQIQS